MTTKKVFVDIMTFCLNCMVHEQKKVLCLPLHTMKRECWDCDAPAWHGACVLPHINLVTAGYQRCTSPPLVLYLYCKCVLCLCVVRFFSYLMREVSVCVRVGCARRIIITSLLIVMITAKCRRDWEGSCVEGGRESENVFTRCVSQGQIR